MTKHKIDHRQLIAMAESFASVSSFADACYRYYFYCDKISYNALEDALPTQFATHLANIPKKYHAAIIKTALIEMRYPISTAKRFAFSERERAICAKISRQTWRGHNMNAACEDIISNITGIAYAVAHKVRLQLKYPPPLGY